MERPASDGAAKSTITTAVIDGVPYGCVNDAWQNTDPGAGCLYSAPDGFSGTDAQYLEHMRARFRNPGARARMALTAAQFVRPRSHHAPVRIEGRYAAAAEQIMRRLAGP